MWILLHLGNFPLFFSADDCDDMQILGTLYGPFLGLRSDKDPLVGAYILQHQEPVMSKAHVPSCSRN
jgi:hypothetical protein